MAENQNAADQASTLNDERATRLAKRAALFEPISRLSMPSLPMARTPRTS